MCIFCGEKKGRLIRADIVRFCFIGHQHKYGSVHVIGHWITSYNAARNNGVRVIEALSTSYY